MAAPLASFKKHPNDVLNYGVSLANWLTGTDVISSASWSPEEGLTTAGSAVNSTGTIASVTLSGGTDGERLSATCTLTTAHGYTKVAVLELQIES